MDVNTERRTEERLRYYWPVWFAEDFENDLSQGQMVDVTSGGAAFTCYNDQPRPEQGQKLTTRFSVPRFGQDESFEMTDFFRTGTVCRVEDVNDYLHKIAIQFHNPLPFRPGEQNHRKSKTVDKLKASAI